MDNSTMTPLQGDLLLFNQLELVTSTTVAGTLYGIAFTLFCLYVHALAPQLHGGDNKRQAKFMLVYTTVIMLCGLYNLLANVWFIQDAYIKHSDYPEGPYFYIVSRFDTAPMIHVDFACVTAINVLTSAIQIWRVWVVWSATPYASLVAVLPTLCCLTFSVLRMGTMINLSTVSITENFWQDLKTLQAEIILQVATTILCTMLISLYLIFRQWQQRKLIGHYQGSAGYMSIVATIIESYTLESIWLLAIAIFEGRVVVVFFGESRYCIEIIAYLLVQYRVASGKAYKSQRGQPNISSLRWNHPDHATTQFEETGEITVPTIPHVSSVP